MAEARAGATIDDLYGAESKAEIVNGELVLMSPTVSFQAARRSYAAERPEAPRVFSRGETADAEPALPGWSMPVDDLFMGSRRR
jgi:hypothetical protein